MAASPRIRSTFTDAPDTNDQELKSSDTPPPVAEPLRSNEEDDRSCPPDWAQLVRRIQHGDETGMEDLYRLLSRGARFYLRRRLGLLDVDDKIHDILLIVVQAIRRGDLREPERLMGFVRTVLRRQVAAHIDTVVHSRRDELQLYNGVGVAERGLNPEQNMAFQESVGIMMEVLQQLSDRDGEILARFYLHEETQAEICEGMNLSETQFRLLKSRAKARFAELGNRKLHGKMKVVPFMRSTAC